MKKIFPIILILLIFAACKTNKEATTSSNTKKHHKRDTVKKWTYNRVLKTDNYNIKYEKANEYYDLGKYLKALDVYEQLIPYTRGTDRGEEVSFKYAMCNYETGDYLYAGYLFKKFYDTYPTSKFSEKALFLSAYCYFLDSPRWSLDQEQTNNAIEQFQLFIARFPQSPLIDSTNYLIDTLYKKLQRKEFQAAKLYYDMEYYKAADIALNNAMQKYPDSRYTEETMYLIAKSNYKYAQGSIRKKQKERYQKAVASCLMYKSNYPDGHYIKDIEKILENSQKFIEKTSK